MPDPQHYETLVLGSGEAGKYVAWHQAKAGQRVAVVERALVGGACPNVPCLPSKNIIHSAHVASLCRRGPEFGAATGDVVIDMQGVRERKRRMVDELVPYTALRDGLFTHPTMAEGLTLLFASDPTDWKTQP